MRLKWETSEKCSDISEAMVIHVDKPLEMSIHKFIGSGRAEWALYCPDLGIRYEILGAESFDNVENKAMETLKNRCDELMKKVEMILQENS